MRRGSLLIASLLFITCVSAQSEERPPWAGEKLQPSEVSGLFVDAWKVAENRSRCALIAPVPSFVPKDATPRKATFSGGWAIAFDQPGLPGTDRAGYPCESCGRSAFGVAGTGVDNEGEFEYQWPYSMTWNDGSEAGYGPEGGQGPRYLAYVRIAGQPCLYNVWSAVGKSHLETLLMSLRYVDTAQVP